MKRSLHVVVYAAVLGTVCAVVLTAAGELTRPYRQANERAERIRNILDVLGAPYPADARAADLVELFDRVVRTQRRGRLDVFAYAPQGRVQAYAVLIGGPGLWGPIHGVLGFEPDLNTIRAVRFYQQEETPGLGGQIASAEFRKRFVGKQVLGPDGRPALRLVAPGTAAGPHEVDAITGATMTSNRVADILDQAIRRLVTADGASDER